MAILYSIPVKASKNNGALRCTIPKEIVKDLSIENGDNVIWVLYHNKKLEVRVMKRGLRNEKQFDR